MVNVVHPAGSVPLVVVISQQIMEKPPCRISFVSCSDHRNWVRQRQLLKSCRKAVLPERFRHVSECGCRPVV